MVRPNQNYLVYYRKDVLFLSKITIVSNPDISFSYIEIYMIYRNIQALAL